MNRRDVLQLLGWSGLAAVSPFGSPLASSLGGPRSRVRAEDSGLTYSGTFWILLHAGGGWDPTSLCDPKGRANEGTRDPMNMFFTDDIKSAGNIRYAPIEGLEPFFDKHFRRLTVINGVDTTTNGHDQGVRGTWSGRTGEGYPSVGALTAAAHGPELPLAFINSGGYGEARGVVRPVRLGDSADLLRQIARPNVVDAQQETPRGFIDSESVLEKVRAARRARLERQVAQARLPRVAESRNRLFLARAGERELQRITEFLPSELNENRTKSQLQVGLAAYRAGTSVAVSIGMGGFDTHSNHDADHLPRLVNFFDVADFALEEAERLGMADRVGMILASDFGRTPGYNGGRGKDHWPISSVIVLGPGVEGNRVIGRTDERHRAYPLDPATLAPLDDVNSQDGVRLSISHLHRELRRLVGVPESLARTFPLAGEDLPLFGPVPTPTVLEGSEPETA